MVEKLQWEQLCLQSSCPPAWHLTGIGFPVVLTTRPSVPARAAGSRASEPAPAGAPAPGCSWAGPGPGHPGERTCVASREPSRAPEGAGAQGSEPLPAAAGPAPGQTGRRRPHQRSGPPPRALPVGTAHPRTELRWGVHGSSC